MPTCETRIRVRYAETDQMGVVYYANYLVWMEVARVEFCKAAGFSYEERTASCWRFPRPAAATISRRGSIRR